MKDVITHFGTIESIGNNKVTVRILQASACSGCHAAGLCQSSEKKEKIVDVFTDDAQSYTIGDRVVIEGTTKGGLHAVLLAYVVPLVIIVAILAAVVPVMGEASAALLALVAVMAYYALLKTQNHRLQKKFSFEITKSK